MTLAAASLVALSACATDVGETGVDETGADEAEPVAKVSQELVGHSCNERADTGYSNGQPFPITVVTVDGDPVEVQTANAFLTMAQAAEAAGITLRINSGFRTNAEQQYLYNCYRTGSCNNGNLAAAPGYSNHQSGHAIDIDTGGGALAWLNANGASFGWKRTVPSESWHWEWWGGGNPKSFCGCMTSTETCSGKDNNCNGQIEACGQDRLIQMASTYAPPTTTDIDGDGRADVCARASDGVRCLLGAAGAGVGAEQVLLPLSNEAGWGDPTNYATLRMGDIDGDGRADLCARSNAGVDCWTSAKTPFGTAISGPRWGDGGGWNQVRYFSTLRLMDVDGDAKDDICARDSKGIVCHLSSGSGFGSEIRGPSWSDGAGFGSAKYYGTLRAGDVNGDGKDDLCVRTTTGMECALATGNGFESTTVKGPTWSDAGGWDQFVYWSSIRLADVNGDKKADLCARHSKSLVCHFSTGTGFGPEITVDALSDANGWAHPSNALTLRTGDLDGDGATDLCVRSNEDMRCYLWKGEKFELLLGPKWSSANGWANPQYYETIRLGDANGDGKADLCARASRGWNCSASTGAGFADGVGSPVFVDATGWNSRPYFDTIMFASTRRRAPEACDPRDAACTTAGGPTDNGARDPSAAQSGEDASAESSGCSLGASRDVRGGAGLVGFGAALALSFVGRRRRAHSQ